MKQPVAQYFLCRQATDIKLTRFKLFCARNCRGAPALAIGVAAKQFPADMAGNGAVAEPRKARPPLCGGNALMLY